MCRDITFHSPATDVKDLTSWRRGGAGRWVVGICTLVSCVWMYLCFTPEFHKHT